MNITSQQIKAKAKDWSTTYPDPDEQYIPLEDSRIAYESFIRGAEWIIEQLEKEQHGKEI